MSKLRNATPFPARSNCIWRRAMHGCFAFSMIKPSCKRLCEKKEEERSDSLAEGQLKLLNGDELPASELERGHKCACKFNDVVFQPFAVYVDEKTQKRIAMCFSKI
jgi:hypothetical protein